MTREYKNVEALEKGNLVDVMDCRVGVKLAPTV